MTQGIAHLIYNKDLKYTLYIVIMQGYMRLVKIFKIKKTRVVSEIKGVLFRNLSFSLNRIVCN